MTKTLKLSLLAVAALLASTSATAQNTDYTYAASNASKQIRIVKTTSATPETIKAKPIVKVVRRSVPITRRTTRATSKGFVVIAPETVTDNMNIYRSKTVKTNTPNLFKH